MFVHIFNPMMSDRTDAVRLTRQCFWPLRSCSRCFCGADAGVLNLVFISLGFSAVSDAGVLNLVFISSSPGLSGSAVSDAGVH